MYDEFFVVLGMLNDLWITGEKRVSTIQKKNEQPHINSKMEILCVERAKEREWKN